MLLFKSFTILIIGFVLLIKGADFFVEGSSAVAKRLRIPSMIIGMTIVAMGTSLPECAVSVTASLTGNNSLAISNAVGSNIFNLLVVCGVCSFIRPACCTEKYFTERIPVIYLLCGTFAFAWISWHDTRTDRRNYLPYYICRISALDDPLCQKSTSQYNFCGFFFCTKSEKAHFPKKKSSRLPPISTSFRYGNVSFSYWAV